VQHQAPDVFSVETWFKTTTTTGGRLVGWSNRNTQGNSARHDRQLYMDNSGKISFGVKPTAERVAVTSAKAYNNGEWHHAVGSLSKSGMKLYIDGVQVGSKADVTVGEHLNIGYWRVGGDTLSGWPPLATAPATNNGFFSGAIDEVAVYKQELTPADVAAHYAAAGQGNPQPNEDPTAAFTSTATDLKVDVDGSGSSDPDGTIASYEWTFQGGGSATGATASHTFAAAGTYEVTLKVTDSDGATDSLTQEVTVAAAPVPPLAADLFNRTASNGWGSADTGGAWTRSGTASNYAVNGTMGTMRMGAAGAGPSMALNTVSSTDTDVSVTIGVDKSATGGGVYTTVRPRIRPSGDRYYADTRLLANGTVSLILGRNVGAAETALQTRAVTGLTVAPGDRLNVRVQTFGTSPTTFRAKVWKVGSDEPTTWTASVTDSTASLQGAGAIGLGAYLSGSATNAPVVASFDNLSVTKPE
jgi:PKD repeat protein